MSDFWAAAEKFDAFREEIEWEQMKVLERLEKSKKI